MAKSNEKFNTSCIKIFELLGLLINDEAEYEKVINLFSDECSNIKSNPNVVLNKYLNTLKIFGIKIKKVKNKYHLIHTPISLDLDDDDIKCVNTLKKFMDIFPDGKNKDHCLKFIKNVEARYDDKSKIKFEELNSEDSREYSIYFAKYVKLITLFERFIQDNQKIQITYSDKEGEHQVVCTPKEINYKEKKITLTVITTGKWNMLELPVDDIINMKQLPTQCGDVKYATTVVFKIKGRLAQNYSLRKWERIEREENNSKTIVNNGEDLNVLLKRLMRYDTQCEIISPKFLKRDMKKLIDDTLANYE